MKAVRIKIIIISILFVVVTLFLIYNPFITLKLEKNNIDINVYEEFTLPKVSAYFFNKNISNNIKVKSNVDINKVGKYQVIYEVKCLLSKKKKVLTVNVVDKIPPNLTLIGNEEVKLCPNTKYNDEGFKATDNYDNEITDGVIVKEFEDYIEYTAIDSSKNKTVKIRKIIYEDTESPKLEILGNSSYTININNKFNVPNYKVSDNCDKNLSKSVEVINNVDTTKVGTYKVTYKVKDSSNNQAEKSITVKVVNPTSSKNNFYTDIVVGPTYIKGILIVNKKYALPSTYAPGVNSEAKKALNKLQTDAKNAGYSMKLISSYRSYDTQKTIYNNYVKIDGVKLADTYSARPGHSEHQTGLAFDVGKISDNFGNTPEGIWLSKNAHKYGFIIRYQKGKEKITGYKYEPWHIRYLGVDTATKVYESGLSLEEYLGV